jgi:hypothetical protein
VGDLGGAAAHDQLAGGEVRLDLLVGALVQALAHGAGDAAPTPQKVLVAVAGEDQPDVEGPDHVQQLVLVVDHHRAPADPVVRGQNDRRVFAGRLQLLAEPVQLALLEVPPVRERHGGIQRNDQQPSLAPSLVGFAEVPTEHLHAERRPADVVVARHVEHGKAHASLGRAVVLVLSVPAVVGDVPDVDRERRPNGPLDLPQQSQVLGDPRLQPEVGVRKGGEHQALLPCRHPKGERPGQSGRSDGDGSEAQEFPACQAAFHRPTIPSARSNPGQPGCKDRSLFTGS